MLLLHVLRQKTHGSPSISGEWNRWAVASMPLCLVALEPGPCSITPCVIQGFSRRILLWRGLRIALEQKSMRHITGCGIHSNSYEIAHRHQGSSLKLLYAFLISSQVIKFLSLCQVLCPRSRATISLCLATSCLLAPATHLLPPKYINSKEISRMNKEKEIPIWLPNPFITVFANKSTSVLHPPPLT